MSNKLYMPPEKLKKLIEWEYKILDLKESGQWNRLSSIERTKYKKIENELVDFFYKLVRKILFGFDEFRHGGILHHQDDIVQEAVFACWRAVNERRIDETQNPFSYFTTIVINAILLWLKRNKRDYERTNDLIEFLKERLK